MPDSGQSSADKRDLLAPFRKRISKKGDVFHVTGQYSKLVSELIAAIAGTVAPQVAIFASGSLARNELLPFTAIDLIYAAPDEETLLSAQKAIEQVEEALAAAGQKVSAVRLSPGRSLTADLTLMTRILEAKLLFGDGALLSQLKALCLTEAALKGADSYIDRICELHTGRFRKFNSSPEAAEPNVKLSPGGLRDLHTMYWVALISGKSADDAADYISVIMEYYREHDLLPLHLISSLPEQHTEILYARYALFRRHLKKADRLEIADQEVIAARLHLKGNEIFRTYVVEYFKAARAINNMMYALKKWRIELLVDQLPDTLRIPLDDQFSMKGGLLFFHGDSPMNLGDAIQACQIQTNYQVTLSQSCRKQILEITDDEEVNLSGDMLSGFRKLFASAKSIAPAIQSMNELRLFNKIIPQFEELQGFTETGPMHFYTAEEHAIKSLVHFEEMENQRDIFGKVFQMSENKEVCRLALLFHNLAKPATIAGYPLPSAELAAGLLERFGYEEETINAVTLLIRKQKFLRDYSYEKESLTTGIVESFAEEMPSLEFLHHLFLITYADLSAVNHSYWTSWKQELIVQLFLKARKIIEEREIASAEMQLPDATQFAADADYNVLQSEHLAHLHAMNDSEYFSKYTDAEIGEHIREIALGKKLSVLWGEETSEGAKITVIARENTYLLSKICGVLAINDLNILNAMIFSRQDGIAIYTFMVSDPRKRDLTDESFRTGLRENLASALDDVLQVGVELTQVRNFRRAIEKRIFKKRENVQITFEDDEKFTIIEVFAPDRIGLLYHVTKKLSDLGLIICFAKINTKNNEISDVFYALDRFRKKVSTHYYSFIENELKELIENLV